MSQLEDARYLQQAIKLARGALGDGDGPFGAVLVGQGRVLAEARNRTTTEGNPTFHAEMVAIREACRKYNAEALVRSTLFTSCEPCSMCLAAMYYARISRVVFAAKLSDAIRYGSGDPPLDADFLNKQCQFNLQVEEGEGREAVTSLFEEYVQKFGRLEVRDSHDA